jgi:pimeloyl-ACP methyl ester carboxylesterase
MYARLFVFLFLFFLCGLRIHAQTKTPFIFRQQEKFVTKHIHRYLKKDTTIETSGAKIHIHYSNNVNKPYLLLLHGMGANARSNWFKQIGYLSKHFNLLVPDLIYFGESVSKETNYSPEFQAEQINQAIKQLNVVNPMHVMGFSYGGLVAAVYNQLFANEVSKLIIMNGPVKFFSGQMADSIARVSGASNITALLVPQTVTEFKALQKAAVSRKILTSKKFKRKIVAHFFTPSLATRQEQVNYLITNQSRYQGYNYNMDITPTLLVWGAKDGLVPLSVGQSLNINFPKTTQLLIFKKAKHDAHFRYSKTVNKAVVDFLNK